MKHNIKINLLLIGIFLLAQLIGLFIVNHYIDHKKTTETGTVQWQELPYNIERPQVENQSTSFIYMMVAILVGTLIFFVLIKFRKAVLLKLWFFLTIWVTLTIAFGAFASQFVAVILALIIAVVRVFKPNVVLHNLSEIFIYGGLAAIFVPILNIFAAFMLLIAISVYDAIAVWKTKHMVKLAEFQVQSKVFAGLFIQYGRQNEKYSLKPNISIKTTPGKNMAKSSTAILGGGDIGFPLIFAGAVMKSLMLNESILIGFLKTLIIPLFAATALFILLLKGDKNKYYPAMPFISAGCFAGYFITLLIYSN